MSDQAKCSSTNHTQVVRAAEDLAVQLNLWKDCGYGSDLVVAKLLDLLTAIADAPEDDK